MTVIECEHGIVVDWGSNGKGHSVPIACVSCADDAAEVAPLYPVTTIEEMLEAWDPLGLPELGSEGWFRNLSDMLGVLSGFMQTNPELVRDGIVDSVFPTIDALCKGVVDFIRDYVPMTCSDCIEISVTTGGEYKCLRCANLERLEHGQAPYVPASGHRAKHYGITEAELQRHLNRAGGHCEICDEILPTATEVHIDHNHATGEVRGILCRQCNQGLGFLGDNPDRLLVAVDYLTTRGYYGTDE